MKKFVWRLRGWEGFDRCGERETGERDEAWFYFILVFLGGAVIGLERPGGYVCVCERVEREERYI